MMLKYTLIFMQHHHNAGPIKLSRNGITIYNEYYVNNYDNLTNITSNSFVKYFD